MNLSTSNSDTYKSFSKKVIAALIVSLLLVGFFNWLVNPYLLFNSPSLAGINTYKTQFFSYQHIVKPNWLRQMQPSMLILGSSRAGNGLDPGHAAFNGLSTFNYAIPGARIQLLEDLYQDVSTLSTPEQVVLTLDFFGFNVMPALVDIRDQDLRERMRTAPLGSNNPKAMLTRFSDFIAGLVSWQSIQNSVSTIRDQQNIIEGRSGYIEFHKDGHWQQVLGSTESQLELFRRIERQYMGTDWFPSPSNQYQFTNDGQSSFETFRSLLSRMYGDGTEAILVISPLHARFQSALALVGLDDEFNTWKQTLVEINTQVAANEGKEPFPLWDFADLSSRNQEAIPTDDQQASRMRNYFDGQHYTAELGDLLLDRIFDVEATSRAVASDFGNMLTEQNIDQHLRNVQQRQADYADNHAEDMLDLYNSYELVR